MATRNAGGYRMNEIEEVEEQRLQVSPPVLDLDVPMNFQKQGHDHEQIWVQHYCATHNILLVGEGDFSFCASLALAFGSASNTVATSLDSRGTYNSIHNKYIVSLY